MRLLAFLRLLETDMTDFPTLLYTVLLLFLKLVKSLSFLVCYTAFFCASRNAPFVASGTSPYKPLSWFSNRTGTSFDDGKAREKD